MARTIDMHVHTRYGSIDSSLSHDDLIARSQLIGLNGAAITEHSTQWPLHLEESLRDQSELFLYSAREYSTEYGHMLVLGVDHDHGRRATSAKELRAMVDDYGGAMILAHPFRYFPGSMSLLFSDWHKAIDMTVAQLAEHPAFHIVDEIEVLNHNCTGMENRRALAIARHIGKQGTAGSDAHTKAELGRCVTVFDNPLSDRADLLRELKAGRFYAAQRASDGDLIRFDDGYSEHATDQVGPQLAAG